MKQVLAEVISNTEVLPGLCLLWMDAPAAAGSARPGQFVLVRCSTGLEPVLRRPVSIHRLRPGILPDDERPAGRPTQLAILFGTNGPGTSALARLLPGDDVDLIAPLGRGFSVHPHTRNVLLIGGGSGVAPLVNLADFCIREGRAVTLLIGAMSARQVFPAHLLHPAVEVAVTTQDGSLGSRGLITDLAPQYWDWADQIFACGPPAMYQTLAQIGAAKRSRKQVQVLANAPIACGVGACAVCAIETRRGMKLACKDGPRFDLRDLV